MQADYEDKIQIKNKELSNAKSQHFREVRDLNKEVANLRHEQDKLRLALSTSKNEQDYHVCLAVRGAKQHERCQHSVEKDGIHKRNTVLTRGSIVSFTYSDLD